MDAAIEGLKAYLGDLSAEESQLIAELAADVSFPTGARIIEEGAPADTFFILLEGRVEVERGGQVISTLEPGAIVGEMALFNANVRTGAVVAREPSRLLSLPSTLFCRKVLAQEPGAIHLMGRLGRLMVQRLQQRDADLLRRAGEGDPKLAETLEEFGVLRKRLLSDWALRYHSIGRPGKLSVVPSKPVGTAADLSVAYSPGVAEPCLAIQKDPDAAYDFTARGHLVGVITNGTAVLGLGNIGALAGKPVMEGKAVLFKRFADLDSFDLEVDELDPERFIDVVCAVGPTFGGINLEDIRAPECFHIERECARRLDIPVFHDDQHGTAIIAGAGLLNALLLAKKQIEDVRVVFAGAGAAGFATAQHFLLLGVRRENLILVDRDGVVYRGRGDQGYLAELAADTEARTLAEAIRGADVFVGVSGPNVLKPEMLTSMARDPVVFALANPTPEIDYGLARRTRADAILATGRSDYPNQVNNVLAFPYIFRGALDCRARAVNAEMKLAVTRAIAELAREPVPEDAGPELAGLSFGRDYLIPKPFDRRLLTRLPLAVVAAAIHTGVARIRPDLDAYRAGLERLSETLA